MMILMSLGLFLDQVRGLGHPWAPFCRPWAPRPTSNLFFLHILSDFGALWGPKWAPRAPEEGHRRPKGAQKRPQKPPRVVREGDLHGYGEPLKFDDSTVVLKVFSPPGGSQDLNERRKSQPQPQKRQKMHKKTHKAKKKTRGAEPKRRK